MRERYVIQFRTAGMANSKCVGIFYSRKKAIERMREYYAQEVEKLLKTMSAEEFNKRYYTVLLDDFIDLFETNTNKEAVFVGYLLKVEDAA